MGWKHPHISLQEIVNLVKGFVEILILGSGYQSTGVFTNWDVPNLRKALRWAEFFESVFLEFSNSEYYDESMKELDGVLSELTSKASFPQGLEHLSSTTLTRARKLVMGQLIRGLPMRTEHLRSVVVATMETDLYGLSDVEDGSLSQYLNKLILQSTSLESVLLANGSSEFSRDSCSERATNLNENPVVVGCMGICIQMLLKRQSSALRALDLASGLNVISGTVTSSNLMECDETFLQDKLWAATTRMNEGCDDVIPKWLLALIGRQHLLELLGVCPSVISSGEMLRHGLWTLYILKAPLSYELIVLNPLRNEPEQVKLMTFYQWKTRTISFFLDKRTVRLVSGARTLFTAPETQWMRLLDQLYIPEVPTDDNSGAKVEVLLWGCIARRWGHIIKHFTSISFNCGNTSDMFSELGNLLPGRHEKFGDMAPSVGNTLIEYLTKLLDGRLSLLWKLHPILPAVAIPSSSILFKVYLGQIESLLRDNSPTSRCCTCSQKKEEHIDCELAERIWCLHASHVRGSHLWHHGSDD